MKLRPFVSVVLLNYNGMRHVGPCMSSLLRTEYDDWELIFIDNGSVDGSGNAFAKLAESALGNRLRYVRLEQNVGYSKANNLGVTQARGELVVLVSNDIEVKPDWLSQAAGFFSDPRNHNVAVAEAYLISIRDRKTMDSMYNYIDPIGFCHPYLGPSSTRDVFYSEGAVMFIRKEVLEATDGLFDGDYFMFFEDIDFCWRVRLNGYRVAVIPQSQAFHVRGGTVEGVLVKTDPIYLQLNTRNRLATLYKNYDSRHLMFYLPLALGAELAFAIASIRHRESWTKAILAGIVQFLIELPSWRRKRKQIQGLRKVADSEITELMIPLPNALRTTLNDWRQVRGENTRRQERASTEVT